MAISVCKDAVTNIAIGEDSSPLKNLVISIYVVLYSGKPFPNRFQ